MGGTVIAICGISIGPFALCGAVPAVQNLVNVLVTSFTLCCAGSCFRDYFLLVEGCVMRIGLLMCGQWPMLSTKSHASSHQAATAQQPNSRAG